MEELKIRLGDSDKSRRLAGLLCVLGLVGVAGIHRFYIGKSFTGLMMLLTLGGFFIWTVLDLITILAGGFKDNMGLPLSRQQNDLKVLFGTIGVSIVMIILLFAISGASEDETLDPNETSSGTLAATVSPESIPNVTAVQLFKERKANATRFDHTYKGRRVNIEGTVGEIENGDVRLVTDEESFKARGSLFLEYVALQDLPTQAQIGTNIGETFRATCSVGSYVLGTMFLKECKAR